MMRGCGPAALAVLLLCLPPLFPRGSIAVVERFILTMKTILGISLATAFCLVACPSMAAVVADPAVFQGSL